jgi:hypothetical protein
MSKWIVRRAQLYTADPSLTGMITDLPMKLADRYELFVILFILSNPEVALKGIALSQPFLVEQAKAHGLTFTSDSAGRKKMERVLGYFQAMEWLEVVNSSYYFGPGRSRAKVYKVKRSLREEAEWAATILREPGKPKRPREKRVGRYMHGHQ